MSIYQIVLVVLGGFGCTVLSVITFMAAKNILTRKKGDTPACDTTVTK